MARVKLTLTCSCCGQHFERIHFCNNSRDAAAYEEWAKENLDTCPGCYAAKKSANQAAKLDSYIAEFSKDHPLPEIDGTSEKQIKYAADLRRNFIFENLFPDFDCDRFLNLAAKLQPENISASARDTLEAAAAKEGVPFDKWFVGYRTEYLRRATAFSDGKIIPKIEAIFSTSSASKLIDILH